jgi:hypothetical protein
MHPLQEVDSIRRAVEEKITNYYYLFFVDELLEARMGVLLCSTKTTFPTLFFVAFYFCAV